METTKCCPPEKYPNYYSRIVIDGGKDSVYWNKYADEAVIFMQNITKIKSPPSNYESPGPISYTINDDIVEKWKNWYFNNRNRLKWSKKKNRPIIK